KSQRPNPKQISIFKIQKNNHSFFEIIEEKIASVRVPHPPTGRERIRWRSPDPHQLIARTTDFLSLLFDKSLLASENLFAQSFVRFNPIGSSGARCAHQLPNIFRVTDCPR